jgi:hypothetical protein
MFYMDECACAIVLADYALHLKSAEVVNYAILCIDKRPLLLLCLVVADG